MATQVVNIELPEEIYCVARAGPSDHSSSPPPAEGNGKRLLR
jgi:hypothetical protein